MSSHIQPMLDDDLVRLEDLLEERAMPNNGMSLEMLDGFFSALVVGPEMVMPGEFFPYIWNAEDVWKSQEEAAEAWALVMAFWNHIVWRIDLPLDPEDPESYEEAMPILALPEPEEDVDEYDEDPLAGVPEDFPYGAAWALGFMQGVSLRSEAWEAFLGPNEDLQDDLSMLSTLSLIDPEQAAEVGYEAEEIPDLRERLAMVMDVPEMLQAMQQRRADTGGAVH